MDRFPIILIHGLGSSSRDWEILGEDLRQAGYPAYTPDLFGHGESEKPGDKENYRFDSIYLHFETWLNSQRIPGNPILIGHSLGGYLSLMYSIRNPAALNGLILIDPLYSHSQLTPFMNMVFRRPVLGEKAIRLAPRWLVEMAAGLDLSHNPPLPGAARRQMALDLKRASPFVVYIPRSLPRLEHELDKIELPTMVIWGERDMTLNPKSFSQLVRTLPNASGHPIPGCGHQPHLGKPGMVNRLVLDFLRVIK